MLKDTINCVPDKSRLILGIFQSHNEKMAKLVGSDFALKTLGRYLTTFDHTKALIEWKDKASDLSIHQLDFDFISEFEFWMKTIGHNTTTKYLTNFKKIVIIYRRFKFEVQFRSLERTGLEINSPVFYEVVDLIDPESNRVAGAITSDFLTILIGQDFGIYCLISPLVFSFSPLSQE
jgi:hypothetical protein